MNERLRIGELAKTLGTTTKTVRYYESAGLLRQPQRSPAGYRLYDREAQKRARLVLGLRRLGISIGELRELLGAKEGAGPSLRQGLLALMDEKLREMDLALGVLQGRRDDLAARHQGLLASPRNRPPDCVCEALLIPCHCGRPEA